MKQQEELQAFWAKVHASAERVRGLPSWTGAGILLSGNFEGGDPCYPLRDGPPEEDPRP